MIAQPFDFEHAVDACRYPHSRAWPQPDDEGLLCDRCGRFIAWTELEPWRRSAIVRAIARRRGRPVADGFNRAVASAMGAERRAA